MRVKLLAHRGAPAAVFESGAEQLHRLLPPQHATVVQDDPDLLFFLTGGSERAAVESVRTGKLVALVGSQRNNSYASATEVMAHLCNGGGQALLLDQDDPGTPGLLADLDQVLAGLARLRGKRLGLVGEVSEWLVASSVPAEALRRVLGIELEQVRWESLPHYSSQVPDSAVLSAFAAPAGTDLADTARVASLLRAAARERALDALTVECFSLVKGSGVTACLPLAQFNAEGFPAACEGDIASAAGMMLGREVVGEVPWMANLNRAGERDCLFSHCTVAPTLVARQRVTTHFETGAGTSVEGDLAADQVTVFRLNDRLTQAFLALGPVTGRPRFETACRTQIEVQLPPGAALRLRERPLGNHHLIFPGDVVRRLSLACRALQVEADTYLAGD
ncbi:MAG TPA: hypothetical protein VMS93_03535 [Candidatus Saccharimonadales bacterium]|nr:hypothetical protein [Candidatus Saccharimonadales bacterium]